VQEQYNSDINYLPHFAGNFTTLNYSPLQNAQPWGEEGEKKRHIDQKRYIWVYLYMPFGGQASMLLTIIIILLSRWHQMIEK